MARKSCDRHLQHLQDLIREFRDSETPPSISVFQRLSIIEWNLEDLEDDDRRFFRGNAKVVSFEDHIITVADLRIEGSSGKPLLKEAFRRIRWFGKEQGSEKEAIDEIDLDCERHFEVRIAALHGIEISQNHSR
jgi:hypothetical protein